MHRQDGEISLLARFASAGGAACVSAVVVNPFDVVKHRLQAQAATQNAQSTGPTVREAPRVQEGCSPSFSANNSKHASSESLNSTADAIRKIVRREGVRSLWRGLDTSLMMAIPSVGVYMPLYDMLLNELEDTGRVKYVAAGALARMVSVTLIAPLDLVRTRTQSYFHPVRMASEGGSSRLPPSTKTWAALSSVVTEAPGMNKFQLLFRGLGATLARDVPFSAVYWGALEPIRNSIIPAGPDASPPSRVAVANLASGAIGGAIASALTQPLDVVKTRMQLDKERSLGTLRTLQMIARQEGIKGLFIGVTPRAMKATPACSITVASYEFMKLGLKKPTDD